MSPDTDPAVGDAPAPPKPAPEISAPGDIGAKTQKFLAQIADPVEFERRAHNRLSLQFDAKFEILLPEDTFRPHAFTARTLDLSVRGMKLYVEAFPEPLYRRLQAKTRYARIELDEPELGGRFRITGKVMWYAYQSGHAFGKDGDCMVGVLFTEEDAPNLPAYVDFVHVVKEATKG